MPKSHSSVPSDPNERSYFWLPDGEGLSQSEMLDTPVAQRMYVDQGEVMRVRVESDDFYDDEPGPPKAAEGVQIARVPKRSPYTITVSSVVFSSRLRLINDSVR